MTTIDQELDKFFVSDKGILRIKTSVVDGKQYWKNADLQTIRGLLERQASGRIDAEWWKKYDEKFGGVMDTECEHGINPSDNCQSRRCETRLFWAIRKFIFNSIIA